MQRLQKAFNLPNEIVCYLYNDLKIDATEALCAVLNRLEYPCRYCDMTPRFGRPVAQLCIIFNQVVDILDQQWGGLLNYFNQPLVRPDILESYAEAIYRKYFALSNVWRFIDGNKRRCARPRRNQRLVYNERKRYHCLKYLSITTPDKSNQTKCISRNSFKKHDVFHESCHFSISFPNSIIRACVFC